jgi:heparan-alpha-glucosaminide N-acetyltransferase
MNINSVPSSVPVNENLDDKSAGAAIQRITSIDILRALTMILMIFVNDLWSLKDIPGWLEHAERGVDGIGLADVVFPAFLFIVGLSLPYAISNRRKKGDTDWQLVKHVLFRTIALLVMGVFLVNGETYNASATGMAEYLWNPLCCFSFILIWNKYPDTLNKYIAVIARVTGIVILLTLSIIYRGGEDGNIQHFAPQWWGILGLIGWAYLASGLITIFSRNNFYAIFAGWVFFCILSMVYKAGFIPRHSIISFIPNAILGGTLAGLTMGGVLTSVIFRYFTDRKDNIRLTMVFLGFSAILIGLSVVTRPYWGLAKLGATPAWLFLCSAFTILTFTVIYWVADVWGKSKWFDLIKPAGTGTILCYLVPYFVYASTRIIQVHLPDAMLTGGIGLLKSFLFALLCAIITGLLIRAGIRMKL